MRRTFADALLTRMETNPQIFLLTGDLGYKVWDEHFKKFPERVINVGASEQAMLDIAVGLAHSDKIPFVYSITPFLIYRPFETLRTYLDHENIPVKLVGSGRDDDYKHDGYSHDAKDTKKILDTLPNIVQYYPNNKEEIPDLVDELINNQKPSFISLKR